MRYTKDKKKKATFVLLAVRFLVAFVVLNLLLLTGKFRIDLKGKPIRMLLLLSSVPEQGAAPGSVVDDLMKYIEENLYSEISFREIAELYHYNEKYIGRLFKNSVGCSMKNYICRRRIEHALTELRDTDKSIIDIAAKVGFENVTYFNRRFKGILGMSPTEYRNAVRTRTNR